MPVITPALSDHVFEWTGITIQLGKQPLLEERLKSLLKQHGLSDGDALCAALKKFGSQNLQKQFLSTITINETLWFRDRHPFDAMVELLEERIQNKGKATVWSAACASGQEAYSLAICLHEKGLLSRTKMIASDLSPAVVEKAKAGRYDQFNISRGLSPAQKQQYFKQDGHYWELNDTIKRKVEFKQANLYDFKTYPKGIDLVLLRNVMIYFPREAKVSILDQIKESMNPDSWLFLGGCETILGVHDGFQCESKNKSIYFQKKA